MLSKVAPRPLRLAMSQAHEQPPLRLRQALASCEALLHPRTATQFPSRPAALADAAAAAAPAELYAWPSLAPAACSQPAAEGALAAAAEPALPADADMTDAEPSEQPPPDPHVAQHTGISGEQGIPAMQPLVPDAAAMTPAPAARVQNGASAAAASDLSPATAAAAAEPLPIQAELRAATAADTVGVAGAAASGPAAAAAASAPAAAVAAAPLAAEPYSSDSEGSLPEIDSGGSDSDGE